jgi:RNA polymerase sigma factor (sigma-70 family)
MSRSEKLASLTDAYVAYLPVLRSLVCRILRHRADEADDVLQEAWIKAQRAVDGMRTPSIKSWLGAIAMNEARTWNRKSQRTPQPLPGDRDPRTHVPDPAPSSIAKLIAEHERETVHRALSDLPEMHREALSLVYLEEVRVTCVARRLGVNRITLSTRLRRGRKTLAASLTGLKAA